MLENQYLKFLYCFIKIQIFLFILTGFISFSSCASGKEIIEALEKPKFTLSEPVFGKERLIDGDVVEITIVLSNLGKVPILINGIRCDHGYLIPEWSIDPIYPNGNSDILIKFHTKSKGSEKGKKYHHKIRIIINNEEYLLEFDAQIFLN